MRSGMSMGMDSSSLEAGKAKPSPPAKDAGALFVLESKGTWVHAGYHLTAATAGPPLLTLPYAMSLMGWVPGMITLVLGAAVSFYSYYLLSLVLEHLDKKGERSLRFRELVHHLLGPKWSYYAFAPLQLTICFMTVVVCILLGGQSMKGIYIAIYTDGHLTLSGFIAIFGAFTLIASQLPSFHSLRHLNLISIILCIGFTLCAVIGAILAGTSESAPPKNYRVLGTPTEKIFGVFNSIAMMITAYGNTVLVEIQATLEAPVGRKLIKGLVMCYVITLLTFISVAITGYWAFGNISEGIIFSSMYRPNGLHLIPKLLIIMADTFIFLQLVLAAVLYSQPSFEILEGILADANKGRFSTRNLAPRLAARSLFVIISAFLAAMLPFFADISSVMGALGFTPLCFILPITLYNLVFKPQKHDPITWINYSIIIISIFIVTIGSIASIRQVVLDAKTYHLFANI